MPTLAPMKPIRVSITMIMMLTKTVTMTTAMMMTATVNGDLTINPKCENSSAFKRKVMSGFWNPESGVQWPSSEIG